MKTLRRRVLERYEARLKSYISREVIVADEFGPESSALKIDADALQRYLAPRMEGVSGTLRVRQFAGGQSNPTYHLACDAGAGKTREWVLRKKPPGPLLPTAHAVDREYRIFTALAGSDVPVPKTYLFCDDTTVIGTEFFVMEYLPGRIFWDATLPGLSPAERSAIFDEMNRVLAALHRVDYAARGLADYGKPGNYFARQIERWTQAIRGRQDATSIADMDRLIEWLPQNIPSDDADCLVHGDFRLDNMIFHPHEPRVRRGARLGAVDARPSARRPRVQLHAVPWRVPYRGAVARDRRRSHGHSERGALRRRVLPSHRARVDPELALLSRVLVLSLGEHRSGRVSPRLAGQRQQRAGSPQYAARARYPRPRRAGAS